MRTHPRPIQCRRGRHVLLVKAQESGVKGGGGSNDGSHASGSQQDLKTSEDAASCCLLVTSLCKCFSVSNRELSSWSGEAWGCHFTAYDLWPGAPYVLSLRARKETKEPVGTWGLLFWFIRGAHESVGAGHDHGNSTSLPVFVEPFALRRGLGFSLLCILKTTEGQGFLVQHLIQPRLKANVYLLTATFEGLIS